MQTNLLRAVEGLFVYAGLDYRIHFEACGAKASYLPRCYLIMRIGIYHLQYVYVICFRLRADFFIAHLDRYFGKRNIGDMEVI